MRDARTQKYGDRTSEDVRRTLLSLTLEFIRDARAVVGVTRIALLGSLLRAEPYPKDADVFVTISNDVDFERLAQIGRRLKGRAQAINSGADVFLASGSGSYLGRICHYRDCFPRRACRARHCGVVPHLNDDLDVITLARDLIVQPLLVVYPTIEANVFVPPDVGEHLIDPLKRENGGR